MVDSGQTGQPSEAGSENPLQNNSSLSNSTDAKFLVVASAFASEGIAVDQDKDLKKPWYCIDKSLKSVRLLESIHGEEL